VSFRATKNLSLSNYENREDIVFLEETPAASYKRLNPHMIASDRLPESDLAHLQSIFSNKNPSSEGMKAYLLKDVVAFPSGAILLKDGSIIIESIHHSRTANESRVEEFFDSPEYASFLIDGVTEVISSAVTINQWSSDNFGHFLVEVMPKVNLLKSVSISPEVPVLVNRRVRGPIEVIYRESFALLGLYPKMIARNSPIKVEELFFVTTPGVHGVSKYAPNIALVRSLCPNVGGVGNRRIWLHRDNQFKRRLLNQDLLIEVAKSHGFELVDVTGQSLAQQARNLQGASVIAGPVGAAFSGIIFADVGASIINLFPSAGRETFFYDLACINSQKYTYVFGKSENPGMRYNSDYYIDVNTFEAALPEA